MAQVCQIKWWQAALSSKAIIRLGAWVRGDTALFARYRSRGIGARRKERLALMRKALCVPRFWCVPRFAQSKVAAAPVITICIDAARAWP